MRDRFEAVLCAAELGVSKPEAGAFHAACEALALRPHEVAYVGDQPDIDGRGARDAGLRRSGSTATGGRGRRAPDRGAHRISAAWTELPELLAAIPVLERRPPSGNVLPAPPERAERPAGGANRTKPPRGLSFGGLWCNWQHDCFWFR